MQLLLFDIPEEKPYIFISNFSGAPFIKINTLWSNIFIGKGKIFDVIVEQYEDIDCYMHPCYSFKTIYSLQSAK